MLGAGRRQAGREAFPIPGRTKIGEAGRVQLESPAEGYKDGEGTSLFLNTTCLLMKATVFKVRFFQRMSREAFTGLLPDNLPAKIG